MGECKKKLLFNLPSWYPNVKRNNNNNNNEGKSKKAGWIARVHTISIIAFVVNAICFILNDKE